jgi:hypothetical protein
MSQQPAMAAPAPASADTGGAFIKTEKALLELRTREFGLTPRARQLLILIDGRRDARALAQFMNPQELLAYLSLLENEGFVRRANAREIPGLSARKQLICEHLTQSVGILAQPMNQRILQAQDHTELTELVPAVVSIVEVTHGLVAADDFERALAAVSVPQAPIQNSAHG